MRARFLLTFVLVLALELGIVVWGFGRNLDVALNRATATAVAGTMSLVGVPCDSDADLVVCASLSSVRIIFECTGAFPIGIFLAAILAFPATWKWKLLGVGLGVPAILAVNVGRLMSLMWVESRFPRAMDWVHVVLWPTLLVLFVVLLWLLWARAAVRGHRARVA